MGIDPRQMTRLTRGLPTKSAKMRALAAAGYARADIARFLKTKYQFVRNVLEREKVRLAEASKSASATGLPDRDDQKPTKVRLGPDGRVVVPAGYRNALNLKEGDVLYARLENGEIHLLTPTAAMHRAQAIVRKFVPEGVSLVDELLEERRQEVAREAEGG